MTAEHAAPKTPSRVVDAHFQGWYLSGSGLYEADYGRSRNLDPRPYPELIETRGPLREVVPPSETSTAEAEAALKVAGHLAAGSLLVALARVALRISARPGRLATGTLLAGREGSWETADMNSLIWNLGIDLADEGSRYHEGAVERLTAVIDGWIGGETYTEVAATLAGIFADVTDELGGWPAVTDAPLRRASNVESLRGWLTSTSASYDG